MQVLLCFSLFLYVLFRVLSHMRLSCVTKYYLLTYIKPDTERVQALIDISRSRYVVIATKPDCKSAQQCKCTTRGTTYHFPKLPPGPCSSVGMRPRTDRHTDTHIQTYVTIIHFASSMTYAKCNKNFNTD